MHARTVVAEFRVSFTSVYSPSIFSRLSGTATWIIRLSLRSSAHRGMGLKYAMGSGMYWPCLGLGYEPEFFELFESNLNQMNRIFVLLIQYPRALIRQIQGLLFSDSVIHELVLKR